MGFETGIEWTDSTWNPIRAKRKDTGKIGWHCERVSPACVHCYASTLNERNLPACGTGLEYTVPNRELVDIFVDKKTLVQPLSWRQPRKIFVCSMTDLFGEFVTDDMIDQVFAVMALAENHTFQVLTKRPDRAFGYFDPPFDNREHSVGNAMIRITNGDDPGLPEWPLANVWIGTTVENQEYADKRIPLLLQIPTVKRFISYEPALGPIDLHNYLDHTVGLDWVICGGESGHGARPMKIDWVRSIRDQCFHADVDFFFKQWGEYAPDDGGRMVKMGKKMSGSVIDGQEWKELPVHI